MADDRILELYRREITPDLYAEIRELWKKHSMAEDERDIAGLISTLTTDCVYELVESGHRWQGHEGEWLGIAPTGEHVSWKVVIFCPWDPEQRLFRGEKVYTAGLPVPARTPSPTSA